MCPVGDAEEWADRMRPGSVGFSVGVREGDGADVEVVVSGDSWDEWPPLSYAENDHILVWWLPEYDEALRQLFAEYQWAWRGAVLPKLESLIPAGVLRAWRDSDPQCHEYSWYNVLDVFAAARA